MVKKKSDIKPGGVSEYIATCPKEVQSILKDMRKTIRSALPDAMETVSYFNWPGYHYTGDYAYNGMVAWFSYKKPYVRLHVWPQVLKKYKKDLTKYSTLTAVVNFSVDKKLPVALIKKLAKESLKEMRSRSK